LNISESITDLHNFLHQHASASIALVPTMGNLHQGHIDLVHKARELADIVVVSIFVNPLQFEAGGDLDNYPRTVQEDMEKLLEAGADVAFIPDVEEIYGNDLQSATQVIVPGISSLWCGASREGHFEGVTTIVNKLFNIVQPDIAVFGEKDFQQLTIIKKMVSDLDIPVEVLGVPTRREADGLAMSSRNGYLSAKEREVAPKLHEMLLKVCETVQKANVDYQQVTEEAAMELDQLGFKTDYLAVCRQSDLKLATAEDNVVGNNLVILAAAYLGKARLIDNLAFVNR